MTTPNTSLIDLLCKVVDSERVPISIRCDAREILRKFQRGEYTVSDKPIEAKTEKSACEHDWVHIEDSHYFCPKCKATKDR